MTITYHIPYHKGDLGRAYNDVMAGIEPGNWACMMDYDCMFTSHEFDYRIKAAIEANPGYGLLVPVCRVGCAFMSRQACNDVQMLEQRKYGEILWASHGPKVYDATGHGDRRGKSGKKFDPMSGACIVANRDKWEKIGGAKSGILGVDNDLHERCFTAGVKVALMQGIYCYHWYRGGKKGTEHLRP